MPNRLRMRVANRVALCASGADPGAEIVLMKAKAKNELGPVNTLTAATSHLKSAHDIVIDPNATTPAAAFKKHDAAHGAGTYASGQEHTHVTKVGRKVSAPRLARIRAAHEALAAVLEEAGAADKTPEGDKTAKADDERKEETTVPEPENTYGIDAEVWKTLDEAVQKRLADMDAERVAAVTKAETVPVPNEDEVAKTEREYAALIAKADESSRPALERLRDDAVQAKRDSAIAKAETAAITVAKRDNDWVTVAKDWGHLGLKPEDVGPAIRKVEDHDADLAKTLRTILTGANAAAADAYKEVGKRGGAAPGSVKEKVFNLAKTKLAEGKDGIDTIAKATIAVLDADPKLSAEYYADEGIRTGADA